jgi:hypothetical protein
MRTGVGLRPGGPGRGKGSRRGQGELVPPGGTVGLILPIAHRRLNEPKRVTIADLTASYLSRPDTMAGQFAS